MIKVNQSQFIGDCRNEELVEEIFGSVSEFARQCEILGNEFEFGPYVVKYDEHADIHNFYLT